MAATLADEHEPDVLSSLVASSLDLSAAAEARSLVLNAEFARIEEEAGAVGGFTPVALRRRRAREGGGGADELPEQSRCGASSSKDLWLDFSRGGIRPRRESTSRSDAKYQSTLSWLRYSDEADDDPGRSSCAKLSFSNSSNEGITIRFDMDGASTDDSNCFVVEPTSILVPAGASRQAIVTFTGGEERSTVGVHSCLLHVVFGSPGGHETRSCMLLRDIVVAPPTVQVDKTRIEWSHGGSSRLVRVRNGGRSPFSVGYSVKDAAATGGDAEVMSASHRRFSVASCSNRVVQPEDSSALWLKCAPSSASDRATLTLRIEPLVVESPGTSSEEVVIRSLSPRTFDVELVAGSAGGTNDAESRATLENRAIDGIRPCEEANCAESHAATCCSDKKGQRGHVNVHIKGVLADSSHVNVPHNGPKAIETTTSKRRDLYFGKAVLAFGNQSKGDCACLHIHLCNGTKQEQIVTISEPSSPFLVVNKRIKVRPRSFVRLPVRFVPQDKGCFASVLHAESSGGEFECQAILKGVGTSSDETETK